MKPEAAAHFLLVGDAGDLPTLRVIVARLPVNAYGQIFVELAADERAEPWEVPGQMTVTWLRRQRRPPGSSRHVHRGEPVARAVMAWVSEWIPDPYPESELPYVLWIGCSASSHVDRLHRHLSRRFENLHLHHPHYD